MRRMCLPILRPGRSNTAPGHFVPRLSEPGSHVKMVLVVYIPRRRRYPCAGRAGQSRGGTPAVLGGLPFTACPGLGESAALSIVEARKGREFISIEEFSNACPKVSKAHIEQLKFMGALDGIPDTSQITLF